MFADFDKANVSVVAGIAVAVAVDTVATAGTATAGPILGSGAGPEVDHPSLGDCSE